MFERFTTQAREVVVGARRRAGELGHDHIGTEHLLLGLLDADSGVTADLLRDAGVDADAVRAETDRIITESAAPGLGAEDAAALEAIGIDLDAVRAKVEESFGPGALTPTPPMSRSWVFGKRGAEPGGAPRFTPRSKKVLELSLREAIRLHHNYIGSEHILLGLLRDGDGLAAKVMVDAGVDFDDLRARTIASLNQAA
jgi:ATP-dependent Clp protease ATP-binding subunit ClpA